MSTITIHFSFMFSKNMKLKEENMMTLDVKLKILDPNYFVFKN